MPTDDSGFVFIYCPKRSLSRFRDTVNEAACPLAVSLIGANDPSDGNSRLCESLKEVLIVYILVHDYDNLKMDGTQVCGLKNNCLGYDKEQGGLFY